MPDQEIEKKSLLNYFSIKLCMLVTLYIIIYKTTKTNTTLYQDWHPKVPIMFRPSVTGIHPITRLSPLYAKSELPAPVTMLLSEQDKYWKHK